MTNAITPPPRWPRAPGARHWCVAALVAALLLAPSTTCAAKKAPPTSQHQRWWSPHYLIDWGVSLALAGGGLAMTLAAPPIEREWHPSDPTLGLPQRATPLPHPAPLLLAYGAPMLGLALAQIAAPSKGMTRGHDFHHAALGLTESLGLTLAITGMLQLSVGRLRPDWRARCKPTITDLTCTGDAASIDDGRRSFPNQSTAYAFAGGTFLALYLMGKLKLFDGEGAFWKIPLILTPMAAATSIAVLRSVEHRAHPEDILIGALIGMGSATIGYLLNFHSPFHNRAGTPHLRLSVAPIVTPRQAGLALQGRW